MTDPPQGRDRSPSVAALAVAVNGLRRQAESLAAKVDALTSTQHDHAAALDDIGELRHQVEKILTSLTGQDDASPAEWCWLTMSDQAREDKFGELHDWVETVYREHYPDYLADQVRPCWPTTPRPDGNWPGSTSSGPSPTSPNTQRPKTPPTGTTAGPPASCAASPPS